MTNTLLPAKYSILLMLFLLKRIYKAQRQRVSADLWGSSYCAELEAVWNAVLTECNAGGDGISSCEYFWNYTI